MKRCPECRRDYFDDSLLYCLEDGASLIQGPIPSPDDPATAILTAEQISSEQATRSFDRSLETGESSFSGSMNARSRKNSIIAGFLGITLVTALGIGSYLFYSRSSAKQIESIAVMPFVNASGNADV